MKNEWLWQMSCSPDPTTSFIFNLRIFTNFLANNIIMTKNSYYTDKTHSEFLIDYKNRKKTEFVVWSNESILKLMKNNEFVDVGSFEKTNSYHNFMWHVRFNSTLDFFLTKIGRLVTVMGFAHCLRAMSNKFCQKKSRVECTLFFYQVISLRPLK